MPSTADDATLFRRGDIVRPIKILTEQLQYLYKSR
jgi:hypothetical protein